MQSKNVQAVLSVSGGMDSTALLLRLLKVCEGKINILNFNYGQKHLVEREKLQRNIFLLRDKGFNIELHLVELDSVMKLFSSSLISKDKEVPLNQHYAEDNQRSTVVPNRNAIFASLAYGLALSMYNENKHKTIIGLGIHSGDYSVYPDCRPKFIEKLEEAFKVGNWDTESLSFCAPYLYKRKKDILGDALISCCDLNLDFDEIFANTNTCYAPDKEGRACGRCSSCIERLEAFEYIERKDPCKYSEDYSVLIKNMKAISKKRG